MSTPTHLKRAVDGGSWQHVPGQRSLLPGLAGAPGWSGGSRGGHRATAPWHSGEVGSPSTICPGRGALIGQQEHQHRGGRQLRQATLGALRRWSA